MPTLYEYCNTGTPTLTTSIYGAEWYGQSFTPSIAHKITSVKLKMFKGGSPGTLTVSIKVTDGSGHPTGSDLTSGTIDGNTLTTDANGLWYEITLSTYTLSANTKYAVVMRCLDGSIGNAVANIGVTSVYAGGDYEYSSNSGSTWTTGTDDDILFEDWGDPAFIPKIFYF